MADDTIVAPCSEVENEALLRAMLDAADVMAGVFELLDDDYRYVAANRNAAAFYGRSELIGLTGRQLGLTREQIDVRLEVLRACVASGGPQTHEYPFSVAGGRSGWFLGTMSALPQKPGRAPQVSFVVIDNTQRREAQAAAERQREKLALALEATGLGLWEYDLRTDVVTWDARMRELFGVGPDTPIDFETYAGCVEPEDFVHTRQAYLAALEGANGGAYIVRHRTAGLDGTVRWVRGAGQVIFDGEGRARRVLGTSQDISAEVEAMERHELMQAELNHRVKNNLAAVQAIASQTLRAVGEDPKAFRMAFESRLQSMARGHDLLTRNAWETASLADVLQAALAPFASMAVRVSGGEGQVRVGPDLAVNLVMVLNELATNAVKYGALSVPAGEVGLAWGLDGAGLTITWRERGGPAVTPPREPGFGSRLTRSAMRTFGGRSSLQFWPEGVECILWAPFSKDLRLLP